MVTSLMVDISLQSGFSLLARLALTAWLLGVAYSDIRTGRIPNWLTLPVMLAAGVYGVFVARHWVIIPIWVVIFILWELNFMMAGDAKLLMALFALFPTAEFAVVLTVGGIIELVPLLVLRYRRQPVMTTLWSATLRVQNRALLPTREELVRDGRRLAWVFALPAVVYVWFFW